MVDNGSIDGSADFLREGAPAGVRLLQQGNIGYTAAINLGFRETAGRLVLLLNADMVVLGGAIDAMVRHMDQDPRLGGIGGHCLKPDGTFERRYARRFPTPRTAYLQFFADERRAERRAAFRRYALLDEDFAGPIEVPQPGGGCLLVRRDLFPSGLASDCFGIYWSDVEVARRIHDAGRLVKVFPEARFVHDHSSPPPADLQARDRVRTDFYVGAVRYFRIYEGRRAAAAVKALFAAGMVKRLARKTAAAAIGREPWHEPRRYARLVADFLGERNRFLEETGPARPPAA